MVACSRADYYAVETFRVTHVKYDAWHGRELFDVNVRQHVHQVTFPAGGETQSSGREQRAVSRPERGYRDRQRYHPGNGPQRSDPESLLIKQKCFDSVYAKRLKT